MYNKEAELGGSDQKVSPLAGKNAEILLVPCRAWKWVYSYVWSCSLCERGTFFSTDLSLENSADSYCFRLALLHSVSDFFFLYRSPSSSLCTVFDSISSSTDELLSIKPSANVFLFGDLNVHHKDWLTYSGGTDRSDELDQV